MAIDFLRCEHQLAVSCFALSLRLLLGLCICAWGNVTVAAFIGFRFILIQDHGLQVVYDVFVSQCSVIVCVMNTLND